MVATKKDPDTGVFAILENVIKSLLTTLAWSPASKKSAASKLVLGSGGLEL